MNTEPAVALHADDDTPCTTPELCSAFRLVYWPGGIPAALAASVA